MHPDPDRGGLERRRRPAPGSPRSFPPARRRRRRWRARAARWRRWWRGRPGDATTVSGPLSRTTAPLRSAAARTRSSFERSGCLLLISLNKRGNSPSCGVSTTCGSGEALIASNSRSGASAKLVSASASSTSRRWADSAVRTKSRVRSPTPAARADHAGVEALVGQQLGKFDHRIDGANHHRGERGGVDGERIPRRGQR